MTVLLTNLPDALLIKCMSFIGNGNFLFVAGVCRLFRTIYTSFLEQQDPPKSKTTTMNEIVSSVPRLQLVMNERHIDVKNEFDYTDMTTIRWRGNEEYFITAVLKCAIFNGNLDVLVWVKTKTGMAWIRRYGPHHLCNVAAKGGQLKVLQWLRSEVGGTLYWDESTCRIAAEYGHFEILKWAYQNGCPWDYYTYSKAKLNGHSEIVKWAKAKGCPTTRTAW